MHILRMARSKTQSVSKRKRTGPKLLGEAKRVRTTLCFDPVVLKQGKAHAKSLSISLSLWIERLMKPHLHKRG